MRAFFPGTKSFNQCINLMDNILVSEILESCDGLLRESINIESRSYQNEFAANNILYHEAKEHFCSKKLVSQALI